MKKEVIVSAKLSPLASCNPFGGIYVLLKKKKILESCLPRVLVELMVYYLTSRLIHQEAGDYTLVDLWVFMFLTFLCFLHCIFIL